MLDKADDSDIPMKRKLQLIAKMIGSHECRGVDRDVFHVEDHQYDYHQNLHYGLERKFIELNTAIDSFVKEMKNQNKWTDVTIVVTSDFGRTLTPNSSGGTDHGWSGHTFVIGGSVVGSKIFGRYPSSLKSGNPLDVGRGRLVPEHPWECLWNPVAQWIGISEREELDEVMPNLRNFPPWAVLSKDELFRPSTDNNSNNCNDEGFPISCDPSVEIPSSNAPTIKPSIDTSTAPSSPPTIVPSTAPSLHQTVPTPNTDCSDSTLRFRTVSGLGRNVWRDCFWVGNKKYRCNNEGIATMCRLTCGICDTCQDSNQRFKLVKDGKIIARDCDWVGNRQIVVRCGYDGVAQTCPRTCGLC